MVSSDSRANGVIGQQSQIERLNAEYLNFSHAHLGPMHFGSLWHIRFPAILGPWASNIALRMQSKWLQWQQQLRTICVSPLESAIRVPSAFKIALPKQSKTGSIAGAIPKHMGVDLNSFFSKRPVLAKKTTLAKLSPYPQKNFRGPYVGLYVGISGRKQKLDKGLSV